MSKFKELFEQANPKDNPSKKIEKQVPRKRNEQNSSSTPVKTKGKRNNPEYTGAFAYIPIKLHDDVKITLLRQKELDFSELVEKLLTNWLAGQK